MTGGEGLKAALGAIPNYCSWPIFVLGCAFASLWAQTPAIPPSLLRVTPPGLRRSSTAILTVEGRNLAGARAVLFDTSGLTAKVLAVRDLPEKPKPKFSTAAPIPEGLRQEASLEITASAEVELGLHQFRVQTLLGTSNLATLDVGALPEVQETEPNDFQENSQSVVLPCTLIGKVGWPGDVDTFRFRGRASEQLVFEVVASPLGSQLRPLLSLRDSSGKELARSALYSRRSDSVLIAKLPVDGEYTISISDLQRSGGPDHFYRLNAGALPYVTEVFPLGLRAGQSAEVEVKGANLGKVQKVRVQAPPSVDGWQTIPFRVKTSQGEAINKTSLAVGSEPEIVENEPNDAPTQAQRVTVPVTINGRISGAGKDGTADEDYFRFVARKGQRLSIDVAAARLESRLDPVVEILDGSGHEVPRATIRCLLETSLNFDGLDSQTRSIRLASITGLHPNDLLMTGEELVQINFVPDQPDKDIVLKGVGGERLALLNTSPQAHPVNSPVYKVDVLESDAHFPPNGLPVFPLTYRNDDGGPGYGEDSRLDFTAPQDGEYLVHLKDIRGLQGEDFAYRLTVREARADFRFTTDPTNPRVARFSITADPGANPNVPQGGRVPILVTADRSLGYQGPIEVQIEGLPKGLTANTAIIEPGEDSAAVILQAAADAVPGQPPAPFQIVGRARVNGRELVRVADAEDLLRVVSVVPPPDLRVTAEPRQIVLEAGKETTVTLHVERQNGFQGRVPCNVLNLPPGVEVVNVGLNGVLVPENENSRAFNLRAEGWASATEQPIYVVGMVESNSPTRHASAPLILQVKLVSGTRTP